MDKEKEIDMQHFASMVTKAQEEAVKRLIEANTIVIDNRFRYVKPFAMAQAHGAICFPPMIMGMELKFANLPNNADFLLFEADKTEYERKVQEIREQAIKEFAEKLKEKLGTVEGIDDYQQVYVEDAINELINEFCETCPENNNAEYNKRNCPNKGNCGR